MSIDNKEHKSHVRDQADTAKRLYGIRLATVIVALVLLPLLIFHQVTHFDFVTWDDPENITNNQLYQPVPSHHLRQLLTEPYLHLYIPATLLVWANLADTVTSSSGTPAVSFDPHKYHLANLVIHILNVLLVFLILRRLILLVGPGGDRRGPDTDWAAGFGAMIFAVHPLQVEPVAWATGMKDLLGAFFSFLAMYLYLLFSASTRRRGRWLIFAGASFAYILGTLSKPSVVVVPVILLMLEYLSAHRPTREQPDIRKPVPRHRIAALAGWLIATLRSSLMTSSIQRPHIAYLKLPLSSTLQRPFIAGDAVTFYLWKLVAPVSLGPDYGRTPVWLMAHGWAYAAIAIPILLAVIAWRWRQKAVWPLAALGIYVLGLLPVSGLVPFDFQAYSTVADRYAYFVMLGPALAFACTLMRLAVRPAWLTGALIVASLAWLSTEQASVWSNTTTLFTQALRVNPESGLSYAHLGAAKWSEGDLAAAITNYRMAVDTSPPDSRLRSQVLVGLGAALKQQGETGSSPARLSTLREAKEDLDEAVRIEPGYSLAHAYLGGVDFDLGLGSQSAAEWHEAVQYGAGDPTVYHMLALLYAHNGRPDLALQPMQQAAKMGDATAQQDLLADPSAWK